MGAQKRALLASLLLAALATQAFVAVSARSGPTDKATQDDVKKPDCVPSLDPRSFPGHGGTTVPLPSHGGSSGGSSPPYHGGSGTTPSHGSSSGSSPPYHSGSGTTPSHGGSGTTPSHGSSSGSSPPYHSGSGTTPSHGGSGSIPDPSHGGSGSIPDPSHGGGGSIPDPSHGGGGSIPDPSHGGGGSIPDPSHGGGGYSGTTPAAPWHSTPTPSTGGGYGSSPTPSHDGGSYGGSTPSSHSGSGTATPTPFLPVDPNSPGSCDYWRSHPMQIWSALGSWPSSMSHFFGTAGGAAAGGSNVSIQDALANTRTDGAGALLREGAAALLNSMTRSGFPYTTDQVRSSFVAAAAGGSDRAAAAQAAAFKKANEGSKA